MEAMPGWAESSRRITIPEPPAGSFCLYAVAGIDVRVTSSVLIMGEPPLIIPEGNDYSLLCPAGCCIQYTISEARRQSFFSEMNGRSEILSKKRRGRRVRPENGENASAPFSCAGDFKRRQLFARGRAKPSGARISFLFERLFHPAGGVLDEQDDDPDDESEGDDGEAEIDVVDQILERGGEKLIAEFDVLGNSINEI